MTHRNTPVKAFFAAVPLVDLEALGVEPVLDLLRHDTARVYDVRDGWCVLLTRRTPITRSRWNSNNVLRILSSDYSEDLLHMIGQWNASNQLDRVTED